MTAGLLHTSSQALGVIPSGAVKEVQTAFCSISDNASTDLCKNFAFSQEAVAMASWYCDQASNAGTTYCKRHALMQKMRALPPDGSSPERKARLP